MFLLGKLYKRTLDLFKPLGSFYPILIILAVPALLVVNTLWNLKSFNRDANFIIRHQAISIADTLRPYIAQNLTSPENIKGVLISAVNTNDELISATILEKADGEFTIISSSAEDAKSITQNIALNQLASGLNQSVAGLTKDSILDQKIWNVIVPFETNDKQLFLMVQISTKTVDEILNRTSKDSLLVLLGLVLVTLILLVNHMIFYNKSLKTKQLEELDKLKDEFISMAAHELRSPITGLIGYLQLLKDKITPDQLPKFDNELDTLETLTKDLSRLIDDLLDVSRIEQGRVEITFGNTDVNTVVETVIKNMTPTAQKKGLQIAFEKAELPVVQSDPKRLQQVISNLVSNAIKYTLKGSIIVKTALNNKVIEVSVKDTGIGIPADHLPKLFDKFHRVKDEKTRSVRGTGLGLWISRQIVQLLGGEIFAESIYGTGTRISFTLPVRTV